MASSTQAEVPKAKRAGVAATLILAAAIVAIVGGIAGLAVYRAQVKPFRTTVLIVDDETVDMGYLLKRTFMSGQEPLLVLQAITLETLVRKVVPAPPYNLEVSEADIDDALRIEARGLAESFSEDEYREWYRQRLNDSQLTDAQFRDLTRARLLIAGLQAYLTERLPSVAEQVRLHMIVQESAAAAAGVKARLDAGEDFASLARELGAEARPGGESGDLGWYVRAGLAPPIARLAFDTLPVGEASAPVRLAERSYAVFVVSEKADLREVGDDAVAAMRDSAVDEWLRGEFAAHRIEYHGLTNGFDSTTDAWIKRQLRQTGPDAGSAP